jgi:hypothetical protein
VRKECTNTVCSVSVYVLGNTRKQLSNYSPVIAVGAVYQNGKMSDDVVHLSFCVDASDPHSGQQWLPVVLFM